MSIVQRVLQRIRRCLKSGCLEDLTPAQRRQMWPEASKLRPEHIANCQLLIDREAMLEYMPSNGVCIEIGILNCEFSQQILDVTKPQKLHLVDIEKRSIEIASRVFSRQIDAGQIEVHHGDSAEVIADLPNEYFDWVYVDGDHSYEGVRRDLNAIYPKLKPTGLIALNDYIFFGPSDFMKYGVMEAVNEFCVENNFEMVFYALQGRGYDDVCLRRMVEGSD